MQWSAKLPLSKSVSYAQTSALLRVTYMRGADWVGYKRLVVTDLCGSTQNVLVKLPKVEAWLNAQLLFGWKRLNHRRVLIRRTKLQSAILSSKHVATTVKRQHMNRKKFNFKAVSTLARNTDSFITDFFLSLFWFILCKTMLKTKYLNLQILSWILNCPHYENTTHSLHHTTVWMLKPKPEGLLY